MKTDWIYLGANLRIVTLLLFCIHGSMLLAIEQIVLIVCLILLVCLPVCLAVNEFLFCPFKPSYGW
jgi:hypothetical protein